MSENDEVLKREAVKRIKNRLALRSSVASYVVVNALLVVVWAVTGRGYFWPGWVLGGWGIGLVLHALSVYYPPHAITDEDVRREMARLRGGS